VYYPSSSQFCVKIPKFSLPWQHGQPEVNFNHTVKTLDLENPLFRATFVPQSLVLAGALKMQEWKNPCDLLRTFPLLHIPALHF